MVGVYPSAWHVAWTAPSDLVATGSTGSVAALAVDVEPTVFWDGNTDDFGERLARWKRDVGFVEGKHGFVSPVSPSTNGSSGEKVVAHYLTPLGISPTRVSFTDVYPVFLIKASRSAATRSRTGKARREQGDAIRDEYDRIADRLGVSPCSLPARIPKARLPGLAASTFRERLVADLSAAEAPLVITLGEEVWATLLAIPALRARPPQDSFSMLYGSAYGSAGRITVNGREVTWLPLVHPGLLKGNLELEADVSAGPRTAKGWATLHGRWKRRAVVDHPRR